MKFAKQYIYRERGTFLEGVFRRRRRVSAGLNSVTEPYQSLEELNRSETGEFRAVDELVLCQHSRLFEVVAARANHEKKWNHGTTYIRIAAPHNMVRVSSGDLH